MKVLLFDSLIELDLSDNLIGDFPPDILNHKSLTKLNLENNRIMVFPITSDQLKDSLDLRLKGNPGYSSFLKFKKTSSDDVSPRVDDVSYSDDSPRSDESCGKAREITFSLGEQSE